MQTPGISSIIEIRPRVTRSGIPKTMMFICGMVRVTKPIITLMMRVIAMTGIATCMVDLNINPIWSSEPSRAGEQKLWKEQIAQPNNLITSVKQPDDIQMEIEDQKDQSGYLTP